MEKADLVLAAAQNPAGFGKRLIITGRCGRMANRLLLFAHFASFAEEHGYQLMNPTFHAYAHLFEGTRGDLLCRYPAVPRGTIFDSAPRIAQWIRATRICQHTARVARGLNDWHLFGSRVVTLDEMHGPNITWLEATDVEERIRPAKIVLVNGWKLRAPELVQKHAEKIRLHFQPIATTKQKVDSLITNLRREAEVVVGVHIRQGDYRRWRGGKYFFEASRYADWMRDLAGQFPGRKVAFLVCSDEPRSELEFPGLTVTISRNSPSEDLYALSRCDYILGPLSTFSQWASFHGNTPLFHLRDTNDKPLREQFRVTWLEPNQID